MKKIMLVSLVLMLCIHVDAQEYSKFAITPRVGINNSNVKGGKAFDAEAKWGFASGIDFEYRPFRFAGISLGCYFSSMSSRFRHMVITKIKYGDNSDKVKETQNSVSTQNWQIPLMLNLHLYKGLTAKFGAQYNWLSDAEINYSYQKFLGTRGENDDDSNWKLVKEGETSEGIMPYYCRSTLTMPVALSYEYKNVELELKYNIGSYGLSSEGYSKHNDSFMVTLGYRFGI